MSFMIINCVQHLKLCCARKGSFETLRRSPEFVVEILMLSLVYNPESAISSMQTWLNVRMHLVIFPDQFT